MTAQIVSTRQSEVFVTAAVDVAATVSGSPFTIDWLLRSLHSFDSKFVSIIENSKVENVTAVNISEGKGYASKVYKVSISFNNLDKPYEVILKVPGADTFNSDAANSDGSEMVSEDFIFEAHNRECEFYNEYAAHIDIPLVKMYSALKRQKGVHPGALLMESAVGEADSCAFYCSATKQQAYNVAMHLTTQYKYFLCLPAEKWVGRYTENVMTSFLNEEVHGTFVDQLVAMKPGAFEEGLKVFKKVMFSDDFHRYAMTDVHKDVGLPTVLTHGDMWTNNLMWKKNADGSLSNKLAAIIDWQIIHEGCMTNDIARYMTLCLDGDVRREIEFDVLRYMFNRIVDLMSEEGRTVDFTYEQMARAYKMNLISQTLHVMVMIPFIFSENNWTPAEMRLKMAQREKVLLRTQLALQDAVDYFELIPKNLLC